MMTSICTKPRVCLPLLLLFTVWVAALAGCSDSSGSGSSDGGEPGGVAFNLSWQSTSSSAARAHHPQSVTGDVCEDYQIEWIHAVAIDQSGKERKREMWPCSDRKGTLSKLPIGTYRIVIQGEVSGDNTWQGETSDVPVLKDQLTEAGSIVMTHLKDHAAPVVVQTTPANGALEVPLNATLAAIFDNAIVPESIDTSNFKLTYTDHLGAVNDIGCAVDYDLGNHTANLSPTVALQNDTVYTATIAVDQSLVVEDRAGNPMQQAKQWTFTTFRPGADAPRIQSRNPAENTMDVAHTADVQIGFSEAILAQTISSNSIYLQLNGTTVPSHLTYNEQLHMVTLTPMGDLKAGSTYTVVVTTDITDLSGYPMNSAASWSFATRFPSWSQPAELPGMTVSSSTSITLETNEQAHISFIRSGGGMMEAIRTPENTWETSSLGLSAPAGTGQDMVIDPNDTRHIVHSRDDSNDFWVCSMGLSPGGGIMCYTVEGSSDVRGVSLAVDNGADGSEFGIPSICFYDAVTSQLKYAPGISPLEIEIVDTGAGLYPSLALAPTGQAHISYFDSTNGHLKYATKAPGGSWVTETVDFGEDVGLHTDIVLDGSGNPHISYIDSNAEDLKYAAKLSSDGWVVETVDSDERCGGGTSIDLDSLGLAHISYHEYGRSTLRYAAQTALGLWHTQVIDDRDVGYTGFGSAIIIDSQDHVHISYLHAIPMAYGDKVRYATTRPQN